MTKKAVSLIILLMIIIYGGISEARTNIEASAGVLFVDPPSRPYVNRKGSQKPDTTVSASASGENASASSITTTDMSLSFKATSSNYNFINYAVSGARFESDFRVEGNPQEISLPLSFNLKFDGDINVSSKAGQGMSLSYASVSTPEGFLQLASQSGVVFRDGDLTGWNVNCDLKVTATLTLLGALDVEILELNNNDLNTLDFSTSFMTTCEVPDEGWEAVKNRLKASINLDGLLRHGITRDKIKAIDLSFDTLVTYIFKKKFVVQITTTKNGLISLGLDGRVWSTSGTKGSSNFYNTMSLESITVPADFNALDVRNLSVIFDSGLVMAVTKPTDGEPPKNSEPKLFPSGDGTYQIWSEVALGGRVSDLDGDKVTYEWRKDDDILFSGAVDTIPGGQEIQLPVHTISELTIGNHNLTIHISDGVNQPVSKEITIEIIDTEPPTLTPGSYKSTLWPPNHKMTEITILTNAKDNSRLPIIYKVTIKSNEPSKTQEKKDASPDWTEPIIDHDKGIITLSLRAERLGKGEGRTYTIAITATDTSGNSVNEELDVVVPHSIKSMKGRKHNK